MDAIMLLRLAPNSQSSCLCFLSVGIVAADHHTVLVNYGICHKPSHIWKEGDTLRNASIGLASRQVCGAFS